MFRKNYLTILFTAVLLSAGSLAAFAQNSPIRGEVKMKKVDGTTVPVAGATVEAYRTDIGKGMLGKATTNKRGEFNFVGAMLGHRYLLSVSGAGSAPTVQPDIKSGMENIVIWMNEGDGRKFTEAEARGAGNLAGSGTVGEISAAEKKRIADLEAKNTEIDSKNKKVLADDEVARNSNKEGFAAIEAKNYDLAVQKFDQGIAAVPDFVGSTPILLAGKMIALKNRGLKFFIEGAPLKGTPEGKAKNELAKKEFSDALAAYALAAPIIKNAPAATDPKDQASRKANLTAISEEAIEVHRLLTATYIDTSRTAEVQTIVDEYLAFEQDAAKKTAAKVRLADIYRYAGDFDKAIALYKTALQEAPENAEVTASLGLSLVALGTSVDPPNKEKLQEGLNYLQKYADTVTILPSDSKLVQEFKQSVKDTVEYLKTEGLKPQTPAKTGGAKRKT